MDGGEDWLMQPILRGILPYSALDSTSYDLSDFVFVCEALDVEAENQRRMHEHATQQVEARRKR